MNDLKKLYDESEKLKALQLECAPNEVLFTEGERSFEMYILLSGKVEIQKDGRRIAVVEDQGSYLGELSTLLGAPRTATVKTMSPCKFLVVDSEKVMDFFASSPVLALKLARMLAERLVRMNMEHVKLERKLDLAAQRVKESEEKIKKRDRQIEKLFARIEKIQNLGS